MRTLRITILLSTGFAFLISGLVAAGHPHRTSILSVPLDSACVIASFRNETMSDLARLLRPMSISFASPSEVKSVYLRDAVYAGAHQGKGQLLTIWVVDNTSDETPLLLPSDLGKQPAIVADRLARGALSGKTFAVLNLEADWKEWLLTLSRVGDFATRGPVKTAQQVNAALSIAPSLITTVDTHSVGIPLSSGLMKDVSMQPWFYDDHICIRMVPVPAGSPSITDPDVSVLRDKSGFVVGQDFINNAFSVEFRDKVFGNRKIGDVQENTYHVQTLRVTLSQEGKLTLVGHLAESSQGDPTELSLDFTGDDIRPTFFDFTQTHNVQLLLKLAALKVRLNGSTAPTLRPEGPQPLGEFVVGHKPLSGTALIEKIGAGNGAIVVSGVFRFRAGSERR
jgi:hypothetical protein